MPKGELVLNGQFEWFREKNDSNKKKHGISFEEIVSIFDDPLFYEQYDYEHSELNQQRFFGIGKVDGFAVIATCYTEDERIHIINARITTVREEKNYEEWCKQFYT